jgi:hypothetical protein
MAVAAPKRRSSAQPAPAPSRTAPPQPKKRPRDRPRPGGGARSGTVAPARKPAAPKRKVAPKRRPAGVIPIAAGHAGRAAVAVTQLPESGLIHRLTRGRAWIGVLGVLLVGIVALNVVTLSFAASSGKIDAKNTELSKENSMLQSRVAEKYGQARLRHEAAQLGLAMSTQAVPQLITSHRSDVAEAAVRLGAAAGTVAAGSSEEPAGEETAAGEEASAGEEAVAGTTGESEFTPEEEAIYNREYEELVAAEGAEAGAYEEAVTEVPTE